MIAAEATRTNGRKILVIVLDRDSLARMQFGEPVELCDQFGSADLLIAHEEHADILTHRFPHADDLVKHLRRGAVRKPKV